MSKSLEIDEFLLARAVELKRMGDLYHPGYIARALYMQARIYKEFVEIYREHDHSAYANHKWSNFAGGYATATDNMAAILAKAFENHPDYDTGWRPEV